MDMTIDQQVALDEALVPHASRLRIEKSNFHLRSDITSKESTLQVVYDVLHSTREMLHICPRIPNQTFDELSFEEEILAFLRYLRHSGEIKKINDVNINRDDHMFTTIKLVSRHQNTHQFGAILHVELTNEDIRNSAAYKEYYAIASGAAPPKTKASVKKTQSSSDTTMPPPTAAGTRLSTSAKGKQHAKSSKAKGSGADEGTSVIPGVLDVPTDEPDEEISWKSSDEDDDDDVDDQSDDDDDDQEDEDEQDDDDQDDNDDDKDSDNDGDELVHSKLSTHDEEAKDEESFDPIVQTPETKDQMQKMMMKNCIDVNINLEGRDVQMTDVHSTQVLEDTHVTLTLVNPIGQQQSLYVSSQFVTSMFNPSPDAGIDYLFESTPRVDVPVTTTVVPLLVTAPTLPLPIMSQVQQAPTPTPTTAPSTSLPNGEALRKCILSGPYKPTTVLVQDVEATNDSPAIPEHTTVETPMNMSPENKAHFLAEKEAIPLILTGIRDEIYSTVDACQIAQEMWEAIERDTDTLKRRRDDADKDEEPFAGSDWGSKRRKRAKVNKCSKGKGIQDHW
nr:hypothetical protein [Tanacetum cinerariifolium]